jgi:hypothetical protein
MFGTQAPFAQASDLILGGQTHEYKVIFRGDGRAIVIGKLIVPNSGTETLSNVEIGLSVNDASQMSAYQLIVDQACSKHGGTNEQPTCEKYKDISSGDLQSATYEKISIIESDSGNYVLSLPSPIAPNMSTAILFAYTSQQYTTDWLGAFSYEFSTPTVQEPIESLSVTVQTDSDLALVGKETTIEYDQDFPDTISGTASLDAESAMTVMTSQRGNVVRESATNLFPGESYTVTGKYSEHAWRLSLGKILIGLLVLGVIIGLSIWKHRTMKKSEGSSFHQNLKASLITNPIINGFITALLISIWTTIVINLFESKILRNIKSEIAEILVILVIGMVFILIGVGPAILAGEKKGWKAGVMVFITTIIWLIIGVFFLSAMTSESFIY